MSLGKPRDRNKEIFWQGMVRRQAKSVLSVRAWCVKHGLREATFYWWRAELARRDANCGEPVRAASPAFVPVRVAEDMSSGAEALIEIVLAGGRRVRVCGRVDRLMLADVVAVLTSASSVEPEERGC